MIHGSTYGSYTCTVLIHECFSTLVNTMSSSSSSLAADSGDAPPHIVEDCLGVLQLLSDGTVTRSTAAVLPPASFADFPDVQWKDVVYDAKHNLQLRMYKPPITDGEAKKLPVLVYFHGGGFCLGNFDQPNFHACCLRLAAELPSIVLSADYRLAPEHRLPAAIDDTTTLFSWLDDQAVTATNPWLAEFADFGSVFVSGDSAGANIVHHVAVRLGSGQLELSPVHVAGYVLLMPFFGGSQRTVTEAECPADVFLTLELSDQFWRLSLPVGASRDHPAANPFCSDSPDLNALVFPPVLVVAGGRDLLRDRVVDYAARLKAMGKPVELAEFEGQQHGFFVLEPWGEAANELIRVMKRFVENDGR